MKHNYDFSLEVPAPKATLDHMNGIINRHAQRVWSAEGVVPVPSSDDETEIITLLFGLGRLVEVNVRMAWERFSIQEQLQEPTSPKAYNDVIKLIDLRRLPTVGHTKAIIRTSIAHRKICRGASRRNPDAGRETDVPGFGPLVIIDLERNTKD